MSVSLSFNGDKSKFKVYMRAKISAALETPAATAKGLCGEFLTAVEYATYFPGEAPYVRPIDPGPNMPTLPFAAPTAPQTAANNADVKLYLHLKAERGKFDDALSKFKTQMLSELDDSTRAMMEDAVFGTMQITILEIRQRLVAAFGVMSPVDRKILFKAALAPYPGGDMRAWQNARNLLFAELADTGEPFSAETKLRWLLESCTGHFEATTELWEGTYPTTLLQVAHVHELHEALITAYVKSQLQSTQPLTAGARHAMNTATEDDIRRRIQAGIAEGLACAIIATKGGTGICEVCKAKVTDRNKGGVLFKWCTVCFEKIKADRAAKNTTGKAQRNA